MAFPISPGQVWNRKSDVKTHHHDGLREWATVAILSIRTALRTNRPFVFFHPYLTENVALFHVRMDAADDFLLGYSPADSTLTTTVPPVSG